MSRVTRLVAHLMSVALLVGTTLTPPATATPTVGETPMAGMYPEVRLRKLHLVRPDLIPYPIAYEVCC